MIFLPQMCYDYFSKDLSEVFDNAHLLIIKRSTYSVQLS